MMRAIIRLRINVIVCFIINASVPSIEGLSNRLLVVGLGRVGLEVACQCLAAGRFSQVLGTKRCQQSEEEDHTTSCLHKKWEDSSNIDNRIHQISFQSLTASQVESSSHILFTIPAPDKAAWTVIENVMVPTLTAPSSAKSGTKWIGLISTTGVYGNHNGDWVTEESDCLCEEFGSAGRLLEFESFWKRQAATDSPVRVRVFRSAGIYGNDRSALHTVYRHGLPAERDQLSSASKHDEKGVTNRVHEEDLAAAIAASMFCGDGDKFQVFNIADNLPESRRVVMEYAARILRNAGVEVATAPVAQETSTRSKRRQIERKMVCNLKMRQNLISELKYPTYKEGLASILQSPEAPWRPDICRV